MRIKFIASLLVIFITFALVIGGTFAWFTSNGSPPDEISFVAGTVMAEITETFVNIVEENWEKDTCREFTWTIKNTGSKKAYLRARLEEVFLSEALVNAWGDGSTGGGFSTEERYGMYFNYQMGSANNEGNALLVVLMAFENPNTNVKTPAGEVKVWNNENFIYIKYITNNDWQLSRVRLIVGNSLASIRINDAAGNPIPELYPYKADFTPPQDDYSFTIPRGGLTGQIFIAAYALLSGGSSTYIPADDAIEWNLRTNGDCVTWIYYDGYWYYCPDPPVAPRKEVKLCLTGCARETGYYSVQLQVEAVQALPAAVEQYWGGDVPCLAP